MVKDYAKLNSESLKATVVPRKSAVMGQASATAKSPKSKDNDSKPLPIVAAILTVLLGVALIAGIGMLYKHRDVLVATKDKVMMFVDKFKHSGKSANDLRNGRTIDQSLSDPTQSMAADSSQQTLNLPANVNLNAPVPTTKKKPQKAAPPQAPQPVFDFYTVLPSGSANNPTSADNSGSSQPLPPPSTAPANVQAPAKFVVDVGYYQDQGSANQMRSQLILAGFSPVIKTTGSLTSPAYQVELGPFDNVQQANQVRQQLQSNGITNNVVVHPQ
jgi:cell division septation protein DedD